jgi:hypothetical protein
LTKILSPARKDSMFQHKKTLNIVIFCITKEEKLNSHLTSINTKDISNLIPLLLHTLRNYTETYLVFFLNAVLEVIFMYSATFLLQTQYTDEER